jgi:hypothetical protein
VVIQLTRATAEARAEELRADGWVVEIVAPEPQND